MHRQYQKHIERGSLNQSRYNSIHGSPAIARQNTKSKKLRRLSVAPVASLPQENEPDLITCPGIIPYFLGLSLTKNLRNKEGEMGQCSSEN